MLLRQELRERSDRDQRVLDLVRDPGGQSTEGRQPVGLHRILMKLRVYDRTGGLRPQGGEEVDILCGEHIAGDLGADEENRPQHVSREERHRYIRTKVLISRSIARPSPRAGARQLSRTTGS